MELHSPMNCVEFPTHGVKHSRLVTNAICGYLTYAEDAFTCCPFLLACLVRADFAVETCILILILGNRPGDTHDVCDDDWLQRQRENLCEFCGNELGEGEVMRHPGCHEYAGYPSH